MKQMMKASVVCVTIMGGALLFSQPTEATSWRANAPETLSIVKGQTSYTLKLGDTLWAISQCTNLTVETLADVNNINLSLGEQYNLPVGRTIYFDGNKVTVKEADGSVVKETVVTDDNKVDTSKNVGESLVGGTTTPTVPEVPVTPQQPDDNSGGSGNGGGETPTDPADPGNGGGETPTDPTTPVDPNDPGEKVYRGEFIDGVNNGAVGTWTNKQEMIDYIEANWADKTASGEWTDNYVMTTNGYGWIATFY